MGDPLLGKRIRQARKSPGLSQAEFATRIGLKHPQSVSNYERGVDDVPPDRLRRISQETGKPISFFLDGGPVTLAPLDGRDDALELLRDLDLRLRALEASVARADDVEASLRRLQVAIDRIASRRKGSAADSA